MSNSWKTDWQAGETGHPDVHNDLGLRMVEQHDIRDYGASTSANDNTEAIQEAIEAAAAVGGMAYVPQGTFKTTDTLEMAGSHSGLCGVGTIDYRGDGYALVFGRSDYAPGENDNYRNMLLSGVCFVGTSAAAGAVRSYAATRSVIERIKVSGFPNGAGVHYDQYGWINSLRDVDIKTCETAVRISVGEQNGASQAGNALTISGGELGAGCNYGVLIGDPEAETQTNPVLGMGIVLHGVAIEGAHEWGLWMVDGWNLVVQGVYFEANGEQDGGHIRLGNGTVKPSGVAIRDNVFLAGVGTDGFGVLVNGADWLDIQHNHFRHSGDNCTGIKFEAGDFALVTDNFMSASVDVPYDFPTSGNFILQRMGGSLGVSSRSGTHGWDWQAQASYLHRYYGMDGAKVAELDRAGNFECKSVIMQSPDGTSWRLSVNDSGVVSAVEV